MSLLILASQGASRRAMLTAAGVAFDATFAGVDEDAAKAALVALSPRDLADALAELKATKVSTRMPGHLVLGSDSLVALEDGTILEGWVMTGTNQEHGIIASPRGHTEDVVQRFPVGTRLRVLPNHACATGAQYPLYHAVAGQGIEAWARFYGW